MTTASEYDDMIRKLRAQYKDACAQNAKIEQEIKQLEEAKAILKSARRKADELHSEAEKLKLDSRWRGELFERAESRRGKNCWNSFALVKQIENSEKQIQKRINELRLKINYLVKIINGFETNVAKLYAAKAAAEN